MFPFRSKVKDQVVMTKQQKAFDNIKRRRHGMKSMAYNPRCVFLKILPQDVCHWKMRSPLHACQQKTGKFLFCFFGSEAKRYVAFCPHLGTLRQDFVKWVARRWWKCATKLVHPALEWSRRDQKLPGMLHVSYPSVCTRKRVTSECVHISSGHYVCSRRASAGSLALVCWTLYQTAG